MTRSRNMKSRYGTTTNNSSGGKKATSVRMNRKTGAFVGPYASASFKGVRRDGGTGKIFVGPSVEGRDTEYVKVLSGNVDRRKPSFA